MAHEPAISIQQTLHGYRDGHRVLAASCPLSADSARTMLVLSDLAGPGFVARFDGYLSGYPLPEDNLYALARTWAAPEMSRPGCVFTHTLLIEYADLAALPDPRVMLPLLRRPDPRHVKDSREIFSTYQTALQLSAEATAAVPPPEDAEEAESFLAALYQSPDRPVLCAADSALQHEGLVLSLLSQQWPRLRRSFAFCLGATAPRYLGDRAFDLQCLPGSNPAAQIAWRELGNAVWVRRAQPMVLAPEHRALLADLRVGATPLRRFLWSYGADVQFPRAAMMLLVEARLMHQAGADAQPSLDERLARIAAAFPGSGEALRLKRDTLEAGSPAEAASDGLLLVSTAGYGESYTGLLSRLEDRADQLWAAQRDAAVGLLVALLRCECNAVGEGLRQRLISQVTAADLRRVKDTSPDVLPGLLRSGPETALEPLIMKGSADYQREVVRALSRREPPLAEAVLKVLLPALEVPGPGVAVAVVEGFGDRGVKVLLGAWAQAAPPTAVVRAWQPALRQASAVVLAHLLDEPPTLATPWLLTALDPLDVALKTRALGWALRAFQDLAVQLEADSRTVAATFFFTLALGHKDPAAAELASATFSVVHQALERYSIPADVGAIWNHLERLLPSLGRWRDWDRCERLRRGFVAPFVQGSFDSRWFLPAIADDWMLRRVLDSCRELPGGHGFLERLRDRMDEEDWSVPLEQRRLLRDAVRRK